MIRLLWRVVGLVLLLLAGLAVLFTAYRFVSLRRQSQIRRYWSQRLLWVCGVALQVKGQPIAANTLPGLVVMNHVSWLDIFALNAVMPVTFVAKSEIRRWPLLGWLVSGTGTIFIERGSRHAVRHVNHQIRRRLARGEHVGFFPEGTTSNGQNVLPFHTSLFAAALHSAQVAQGGTEQQDRAASSESAIAPVPVMPMRIRYLQNDMPSDIPAYIGNDTLVGSIVKILSHRGLQVELKYLPVIERVPPTMTRHALAAAVEQEIRQSVTPLAAPSRLF